MALGRARVDNTSGDSRYSAVPENLQGRQEVRRNLIVRNSLLLTAWVGLVALERLPKDSCVPASAGQVETVVPPIGGSAEINRICHFDFSPMYTSARKAELKCILA